MNALEQYVAALLDFAHDARSEDQPWTLPDIYEIEEFFLGDPLD